MNIEEQVVSLELAKELKEAGYKQEGVWWWTFQGTFIDIRKYSLDTKPNFNDVDFVAPTVAELGVALPKQVKSHKSKKCFEVSYNAGKGAKFKERFIATKIEADARAKMWLYLKKEDLI